MITYTIVAAIVLLVGFNIWRMRPDISGPDANRLVATGARLIDVRSTAEYAGGGLPQARNLPIAELGHRVGELGDKTEPIVVYCASGARSAAAKRMLVRAGFSNVHNLGSMRRWG